LKTSQIEDKILIFFLKKLHAKQCFGKLSQIYLMEKVQEMAWLPFPGIWCTKKINKEMNS
jgi:hypothetical protein